MRSKHSLLLMYLGVILMLLLLSSMLFVGAPGGLSSSGWTSNDQAYVLQGGDYRLTEPTMWMIGLVAEICFSSVALVLSGALAPIFGILLLQKLKDPPTSQSAPIPLVLLYLIWIARVLLLVVCIATLTTDNVSTFSIFFILDLLITGIYLAYTDKGNWSHLASGLVQHVLTAAFLFSTIELDVPLLFSWPTVGTYRSAVYAARILNECVNPCIVANLLVFSSFLLPHRAMLIKRAKEITEKDFGRS